MPHATKLFSRLSCFLIFGTIALLGTFSGVRAQQNRPAELKMAPALRRATPSRGQTVRVSVRQKEAFLAWARQALPANSVQAVPQGNGIVLQVENLTQAQLQQLSVSPYVNFVDVPNRRAHDERQLNQSDMSVNRITTVHTRFPQFTGLGLTISIKEDSFDPSDIDFKGRVVPSNLFKTAFSPHATAIATLIGGAGNSAPSGQGVAWQARLATSSYSVLLPDDGAALTQAGVSVQNHSYGVAAVENYYGLESQAYDQQTRQYPSLLHVFSSGNVGTQTSTEGRYAGIPKVANLTGQFKTSKNTLCVGATDELGQVAPLSSRGPAYDGRIKPELVAYGAGGTSESAALVSGVGALVQQAYQVQQGGLPASALVKAVLLNSADDTGRPGPDFDSGFGQVDAAGAIQTVQARHFFLGSTAAAGLRSFPLTVPVGQQELKVTLAWTDPEASPTAPQALLNDLDLTLVHVASGRRWQPWVLSSYPHPDSLTQLPKRRGDHLNNVEQVSLTVPEAGDYVVQVRGLSVTGTQEFGVAYEYTAPGFEWIRPGAATNLRPGAANILRWSWAGPPTTGQLQYQPLGQSKWRVLQAAVPLGQGNFTWAVPDTTTLARVRLITGSAAFLSDTFTIAPPQTPTVGYACDDEALLLWKRIPGAQRYQIYRLRQDYLEPYLSTADTSLVLDKAQMQVRSYAVAPVFGKILGDRGNTIDFTEQGTACYVKNFLPRTVVTDTVLFDAEVGTLYRLKSLTLERLGAGGAQVIQVVTPVTSRQLTLQDAAPNPGRNEYRLRLELVDGRIIYSQTEEVQFTRPDEVQAYPNPVVAGQPLQLLVAEAADVRVQFYDMTGRLRRQSTESGAIKVLATDGLAKGMYIIKVITATGTIMTTRLVVL
ncbi:S8 family serine peptidase [Hymenobacter chitinivorans]|uniref:Putative secreted protein (Por secretion system target) n=1 Tax=Hymenobacter chitinivorans DSM 11115 TaxID=1121954 RepID=A0A2M9BA89_9BACT|nr:S8 family serine peptidase [Hymenobacter chitinivorans]PJJ54860.1 putative secreted protein (Por secretion system target) [Hymenobacter chitinivorans DSM 11115]